MQIATPSYSLLQATIQDCKDCLGLVIAGSKLYGDHTILPNGSIWQFISYDCMEKTVGRKCDILFLNEAVLLPEQAFATLMQGVRKFAILNFNPTKRSYIDKYVQEDKHNLLITTFKDNEFLTPAQIEEFENIKKRAQSPTASIIDQYQYQVYYCGHYQDIGGQVFPLLYTITDEEFDRIDKVPSHAIDFGFVENKDHTAMAQIKIFDNCLYCKELLYDNTLTLDKDLAIRLYDLGFTCYDTISCDYGGLGTQRIKNLRTAGNGEWDNDKRIRDGFDCVNAIKHKVLEDIQRMLQFDKIYVTESSINLRKEMESYTIDENGKPHGPDHLIDCIRYATNFAIANQY